MSDAPAHRLAALTGLALAAALALWWLGRTRLALADGADASGSAQDLLHVLWLVRGMALAALGARVGASHGWRPGATAALGLIAPAWPLLALGWSASQAPLVRLAVAELLLLAAGMVLPWLGSGLRRALPRTALAEAAGTAIGLALAASLWSSRGGWFLAPS